eukprot:gi/632962312/ref/XP_007897236.1/ PREDICTED: FERM and PDZ domain-containing protein 1 [Callorhinchus milii]
MEEPEANLVQVRKSHKVEQMVSKWLRLTRDNSQRNRNTTEGASATTTNQSSFPLKVSVRIYKDSLLEYGFTITEETPLCVKSVTADGPGEGKLFPGDQILNINNVPVEDIAREHLFNIISECGNSLAVTVLRYTTGPKSSFLTEEKRARLKSNPVKVRFAEEVMVNGHTQGNSLIFMPNVLKLYLENGQTKAFKYDSNTTVKDIILTLKQKLSIRCIEHFALVLKEQYSTSKVYLLHEDEIIEQVVEKREPHDYKCLFRVCFLPKDPLDLLRDDPVAFEYLYKQSCNDVLQERFAMEMKCNIAIRLAALQIQECILSSKQHQKVSLKYIEKDWGIENFVSPTLLHNMKEKDIRKAINYHLKNNHSLVAPGQKLISTAQTRLNYLNILGDLRTYGGKIFNVTLMLQDRESFVTLLIGAKYGISQVINSKLNIMNLLTNFRHIRKLELTFECEKVSMVKIHLQDVKPLTLLLEAHYAKDLVCLIAGYHKLYVKLGESIFTWPSSTQNPPFTNEEGEDSRGCSDSESSSEIDSSLEMSAEFHKLRNGYIQPLNEEDEENENSESEATDSDYKREEALEEMSCSTGDTSDINEVSQERSDCERSCSIDSMEELDVEVSASNMLYQQSHCDISEEVAEEGKGSIPAGSLDKPLTRKKCTTESKDSLLHLSEAEDSLTCINVLSESCNSATEEMVAGSSHDLSDKSHSTEGMESCNQCHEDISGKAEEGPGLNNWTDSILLAELPPETPAPDCDMLVDVLNIPILDPPPGFGDSSSDDEFFDAADRLTPVELPVTIGTGEDLEPVDSNGKECEWNLLKMPRDYGNGMNSKSGDPKEDENDHTRHSTNTEKQGYFTHNDLLYDIKHDLPQSFSGESKDHMCCYERDNHVSEIQQSPTLSSLKRIENEPALMETKPIGPLKSIPVSTNKKVTSDLMEMEPDTMETKSVTESIKIVSPVSATRYRGEPGTKENCTASTVGKCRTEGGEITNQCPLNNNQSRKDCPQINESNVILELGDNSLENPTEQDQTVYNTSGLDNDEPYDNNQQTANKTSEGPNEQLKANGQSNIVSGKEELFISHSLANTYPNKTATRQTLYQVGSEEALFAFNEEIKNREGMVQSFQEKATYRIKSEIKSLTSNVKHSRLPEKSRSDENISISRGSSRTNEKSPDMYSFDMTKVLSNLNRVSFKTFGMAKHLSAPTLQGKMENRSVQFPAISKLGSKSLVDNLVDSFPKTEENARMANFNSYIRDANDPDPQVVNGQCSPTEFSIPQKNKEIENVEMNDFSGHLCKIQKQRIKQVSESLLLFPQTDVDKVSGAQHSTLCSQDKDLSQEICLPPRTSKKLHEVEQQCSLTQESCGRELVPRLPISSQLESILNNSNNFEQPEDQLDSSVEFENSVTLTMDSAGNELPVGGMEACSCRLVYQNCFRGSVSDVNDDKKDPEPSTESLSPRTIPPSSGSPLSEYHNTFTRKSDETVLSGCLPGHLEMNSTVGGVKEKDSLLSQFKDKRYNMPSGFTLVHNDIAELCKLLKEDYRASHTEGDCAILSSRNKQTLYTESRKLMSTCQKAVKIDQTPDQMLMGVSESFQTLARLTATCLRFTTCMRCIECHTEVVANLKRVICIYKTFVRASENACGKELDDMSVKLLARECTELTASVFCLTRLFTSAPPL